MSEVIRFTSRQDVSWVDVDSYPEAGGCNVLCLTDRELSILRQFCFPSAISDRALRSHLFDQWFAMPTGVQRLQYDLDVTSLLDKLGRGATMDCTDLLDAMNLAAFNALPPPAIGGIYSNTSLAAGNNTVTIWTVAAEHQLIVNSLVLVYSGTGATSLRGQIDYVDVDMGKPYFAIQTPVASGTFYQWLVHLNLSAGDALELIVTGASAGDGITVYWTGAQVGVVAGN